MQLMMKGKLNDEQRMIQSFSFSWFFDDISREEAINALQNQSDGTFLVRPSTTIQGDLVLCVK